jgi:hypothetical protein
VHRLDRVHGFYAAHLGHHDVHADDVGPQAFGEFECTDTILGLADDRVFAVAQDGAQQRPHQLAIVNDHDARNRGRTHVPALLELILSSTWRLPVAVAHAGLAC